MGKDGLNHRHGAGGQPGPIAPLAPAGGFPLAMGCALCSAGQAGREKG